MTALAGALIQHIFVSASSRLTTLVLRATAAHRYSYGPGFYAIVVTAFTPRAAAVSSVLGDDKDTLSAAVIYTAARLTDFTVIENSIVRGHQGYSSAHLRLSAGPRALAFQSPTRDCFLVRCC